MKRVSFLLALSLAVFTMAAAQTQTRERRSSDNRSQSSTESNSVRDRVVTPDKVSNHSEKQSQKAATVDSLRDTSVNGASGNAPSWGNTAVNSDSVPKQTLPERTNEPTNKTVAPTEQNARTHPKLIQSTALITEATSLRQPIPPANATARVNVASTSRLPATSLYRVGVGDVLDIRLANMPTRESTLYTVLNPGVVEYPLLSGSVAVDGMTTEEIAALLNREIKVIDNPIATVTVRDYASHAVTITGMVDSPGRKILRREAMPLYAVLAEALPRPEATSVTIVRGGKNQTLSMANEQSMATLVMAGDIIRLSGESTASKQFFYVGGDVTASGEREYRAGMTLTQALLAAGGVARGEKASAKVARRSATGFLITTEYNVRAIEEGKAVDPVLEAGDRIEVKRGV